MKPSEYFYHRSIRKIVTGFGTIFNNIEIIRFDKNGNLRERFRVILSHGNKEKYIRKLKSDPNHTKSIATLLPRLSFTLEDISYDPARKQISSTMSFYRSGSTISSHYAPVPYNFHFLLSLYARNLEDGLQILEQILPMFTPDYSLSISFLDNGEFINIPVTLNDVSQNFSYDGELESPRVLIWDLTFTVKGYIWPIVNANTNIIRTAIVDGYDRDVFCKETGDHNSPIMRMIVKPDPEDAEPEDDYGFKEYVYYYPNIDP